MVRIFLVFGMILWTVPCIAQSLKVYFLNVGEGESTYIETPSGQTMLIDAGNIMTGNSVVQFFRKQNISALQALVITHPHYDHMSGVFQLLSAISPQYRYDNGQLLQEADQDIYRWYREFYRKDNYEILRKGVSLDWNPVKIEILSPGELTGDWNRDSLVMLLRYGEIQFLFMADATTQTETQILQQFPNLRADVVKVGHHGDQDASSPAFVKALHPRYAVISTNSANIRGYPSPQIVKRWTDAGASVLTTFNDGTILMESDGHSINLRAAPFSQF
ncbi:MAG: MBL fold metallo-hydrolase [SAR324 cluster bacterium]|nr:MBL fold metallo-hydrolase [SAR324 cluster bacterium]